MEGLQDSLKEEHDYDLLKVLKNFQSEVGYI